MSRKVALKVELRRLDSPRGDAPRTIITRLLTKRFGTLSVELKAKINALEIDLVESLGEDLLDFKTINDLLDWFEAV